MTVWKDCGNVAPGTPQHRLPGATLPFTRLRHTVSVIRPQQDSVATYQRGAVRWRVLTLSKGHEQADYRPLLIRAGSRWPQGCTGGA